ncbi:LacI family DNA-binding transcriptional regulator [Pediococcus stilesii]|uniref:LacI family DNA-binding transcriptional regulator n=1 Tax=Pediococcus stilesii TaxID=331679 RepID=A0A5R9BRF9_9LACO|nr:LacI family DNA-binding transcriptional regulator [Pediococcus stilesii]TLQ03308.1 LacI family DNA-binding transcriptional regulator [Pediococcus stilesii]
MANIRDIAKRSGYSASTVSRFINHSGYVSDTAREEIKQVIDELDYVPNAIARDLSTGKTHTIGVVVPDTGHPFFTQLLYGIMDTAFAEGYNVLVLKSQYDEKIELKYLEKLHRKAYDALIFTSHKLPLKQLESYQKYGPVVCCENPGATKIAASYVMRENAYVKAFDWINHQGFSRIAILLSRSEEISSTSKTIFRAYQHVFKKVPLDNYVFTNLFNYQDGYRIATAVVQKHPDFIFGNSDDIVAGVRQYYLDHNLPLPALMGQENQISGKILNLMTIDHHLKRVGKSACELAIRGNIQKIAVESDFIMRNATAKFD